MSGYRAENVIGVAVDFFTVQDVVSWEVEPSRELTGKDSCASQCRRIAGIASRSSHFPGHQRVPNPTRTHRQRMAVMNDMLVHCCVPLPCLSEEVASQNLLGRGHGVATHPGFEDA